MFSFFSLFFALNFSLRFDTGFRPNAKIFNTQALNNLAAHKCTVRICTCIFTEIGTKESNLKTCRLTAVREKGEIAIFMFLAHTAYVPFLGIARSQPQFPHSCVFVRFICSQDQSTYFLQQNSQTHRGNI